MEAVSPGDGSDPRDPGALSEQKNSMSTAASTYFNQRITVPDSNEVRHFTQSS